MCSDFRSKTNVGSNNTQLVSVIMPCYNAEDFIEEAIESVVKQTWKEWELLVIDDGSSDQSRTLISKWAEKDNRIHAVYNEKNVGVSETRNRGISLSSGQWIAFLDSDDVWKVDKLEKQLSLAKEMNSQFVFTGINIINQKGSQIGSMVALPNVVKFRDLQRWNMITCASVLLARSVLDDLRFEHDDSREDYLLWLRAIRKTKAAHAVLEPLVMNRIISGSRSANKIRMIRDTYRVHRHLNTGRMRSGFYTVNHFIKAYMTKYRKLKIRLHN